MISYDLLDLARKLQVESLLEWFTKEDADTEACLKYLFTFRS